MARTKILQLDLKNEDEWGHTDVWTLFFEIPEDWSWFDFKRAMNTQANSVTQSEIFDTKVYWRTLVELDRYPEGVRRIQPELAGSVDDDEWIRDMTDDCECCDLPLDECECDDWEEDEDG